MEIYNLSLKILFCRGIPSSIQLQIYNTADGAATTDSYLYNASRSLRTYDNRWRKLEVSRVDNIADGSITS